MQFTILLILSILFSQTIGAIEPKGEKLLNQLHAETWNCLDSIIDPITGFPQDTQYPGGHTNTTNIGLYLAALCVAKELG